MHKTHENLRKQQPLTSDDIAEIKSTIEEYREQLKVKIPRVKRGARGEDANFQEVEEPITQTSDLYELDMYLDHILEE